MSNPNYCNICHNEITEEDQADAHTDPYGGVGDVHEQCCPCTLDPDFDPHMYTKENN